MHTLGVRETAVLLAKRYGADQKKAEMAAILHDICKYHDLEPMIETVTNKLEEAHWAEYGQELLHAPCGAYYVRHNLGITDKDVLMAIRSHTTGRSNMSLLEKVVFLADYIEPNRHFEGVQRARELAEKSLDQACLFALTNTIIYLLNKQQAIHPETIAAYNSYVLKGDKTFE
ncbi:hydrolase, YqeK [Bacillus sp. JCM 19046]|nr:hydrolase, YqeK [Bacillus sp. JCM 19046]